MTNVDSEWQYNRAASVGDVSTVSRLLYERAVPVDYADGDGTTALMLAAANGHIDIVQLLVAASANVNAERIVGIFSDFYNVSWKLFCQNSDGNQCVVLCRARRFLRCSQALNRPWGSRE